LPTTIDFGPSLIVRDFRAVGPDWIADCRYPTTTALRKMTYVLRVEAVGFDPKGFEYELSPGFLIDGEPTETNTIIRHAQATELPSHEHALLLQTAPVPELMDGYGPWVRVRSEGTDGNTRKLYFTIKVRNPLQTYYNLPQTAEIFTPQAVSACFSGSG